MLSNFSSLVHCVFTTHSHQCTTFLCDILISCEQLKCLNYTESGGTIRSISVTGTVSLQQLCINSDVSDIPDTFMSSISAHGRLIHVVLCVKTVTSEGVTVLVVNSPNLLTLHVSLCGGLLDDKERLIQPKECIINLRQLFSHRKLFKFDGCILTSHCKSDDFRINQEKQKYYTDLFSLWS